MTLSAYNNDNQRMNTFNQTDLTTKFTTGGLEHTVLTGIELGHQDSDNKRNTGFFGAATSATVSTANPYAIATSFRPNGTDANNKVSADVAALYAQDQIALTQQWKLLAGLRYDYFSTFGGTVNPRAALIYQPWDLSSFKAIYGTA